MFGVEDLVGFGIAGVISTCIATVYDGMKIAFRRWRGRGEQEQGESTPT